MKEDFLMIEKNQTWMLINKPRNKNIVGVKWIYRTNLNLDGSINKLNTKLHSTVSYFLDTYALVPRLDTIRLLLALAAQKTKVYILEKALYGLKQALRAWYSRIDDPLLRLRFKKTLNEVTLDTKVIDNNGYLVVS
ncbi:Retrovirus-related Pol polyprotein from transposon TNT 1-94 [Gossypium australe]|uniref:Retrovirus-related Pol polyprotein from transposon TNT 1-94 n=1 Tax=Gossypium australe TaxID=47621 RepID=A0A5B6W4B9_9ROSI|nr:Retrovirus-related Pol polyprotein from transposon TNT 1-94 [Gossypium australe]